MEPFIRDYSSILKPEVKFYSNHSVYNDIAGPLEQTKKLASYVLYFSVLAAVLIIGLTVLMFMKERKHELGILMSLGELKKRIATQVVLELLIISILALSLSLITGQVLANGISESMIRDELVVEGVHEEDEDFWHLREEMEHYADYISGEEIAEAYDIAFSYNIIVDVGLLSC